MTESEGLAADAGTAQAPGGVLVSTDEVEPGARFDFWRHVLSDRFGGTELHPRRDVSGPFAARLHAVQLGDLTLCRVAGCPADVVRPAVAVDQAAPEVARFHLEVPLRGTALLAQAGRETTLRPGDFALCDNGSPFRYGFTSFYDSLVVKIPRTLLLSREPRVAQLTAVAVRGDDALGALLSHLLRRAADLSTWSTSPVASVLAAQVIDLVVTVLSAQLGPAERRPARSGYLVQAQSYLQDYLAEPDLTPDRVAQAVGISVRYLHLLFHDAGTTVTRTLAELRLARSRQLLSSRHHDALPVTEIATTVGFRDLSHFSRSFKAAYGLSPRAYRASLKDG